jgi:hypothetical protein
LTSWSQPFTVAQSTGGAVPPAQKVPTVVQVVHTRSFVDVGAVV